jgi:hypothetical protein
MVRSRLTHLTCFAAVAVSSLGCSGNSGTDSAATDDLTAGGAPAATTEAGFVYFHGMSHLGFDHRALAVQVGATDLLTPTLSDSELSRQIPPSALAFISAHKSVTVSGYSLGRVPVLRIMMAETPGVRRVVLIDPTFDSQKSLGKSGGAIARGWLEGSDDRTFMLVYGDATRSLDGQSTYVSELSDHPRAQVCAMSGDHERFRRDDMTAAVVATGCADLEQLH